jgi:hypothetical protein
VQGQPAGHQVALAVQPGQRGGVAELEGDVAQRAPGGQALTLLEHLRGEVEDADVGHVRGQGPAQVSRAGRDVEDLLAGRRRQQRDDPVQVGRREPPVVERLRLDAELLADGVVVGTGPGRRLAGGRRREWHQLRSVASPGPVNRRRIRSVKKGWPTAGRETMTLVALITWIMTVCAGLYLLAIWLIEYDIGAPGGAVSKLPRTVVSGHVLLATSGLLLWIGYVILDRDMLAWIALGALLAVVLLGLTMLGRWIMVRRAIAAALRARTGDGLARARVTAPAESAFPVPVVVAHGVLAFSTLTLVLLTVFGVGGS